MTSRFVTILAGAILILSAASCTPANKEAMPGGGGCTSASNEPLSCDQMLVNPVLVFDGHDDHGSIIMHVANWCDFPNDLFANSTDFPCGQNPSASRGRVAARESDQGYGNSFCGFNDSADLKAGFWFTPRNGQTSGNVLVKIKDLKCDKEYVSAPVHWSLQNGAENIRNPIPDAILEQ